MRNLSDTCDVPPEPDRLAVPVCGRTDVDAIGEAMQAAADQDPVAVQERHDEQEDVLVAEVMNIHGCSHEEAYLHIEDLAKAIQADPLAESDQPYQACGDCGSWDEGSPEDGCIGYCVNDEANDDRNVTDPACPHFTPQERTEEEPVVLGEHPKPVNYVDGENSVYFVDQGIGTSGPWFTLKHSAMDHDKKSSRRVKSKFLPDRPTQSLAQFDLNTYAEKHGLTAEAGQE
jgi:hypothetical protein